MGYSTCFSAAAFSLLVIVTRATSCPPWFYFNNDTQQCECGEYRTWKIRCNQPEQKIEVSDGYCVSYVHNKYYAGYCLYAHVGNYTDRIFSVAPSDPERFEEYMCGHYNRRGLLCGRCIDGYGPAVYSPEMKCVDCSKLSLGVAVVLFTVLEFVPITLFFIFVLVTRLNITNGPLLGYIMFCQAYMVSIESNFYIATHVLSQASVPLKVLLYSSLGLSNLWLLRIAWIFSPPFCISDNFTNIHLQLIGLIRSIIPLVVLVATCTMVELHKRNCRIIGFVWKCLSSVLKKISFRPVDGSAVIHTFSSFIFLSMYNLDFALVSAGTSNPVSQMDWTEEHVVFFDPTLVWFSHMHLIYLLVMFALYLFLVILPSLLLMVYPTRLYHFISRFMNQRKQLAITAFAEALHSCFKDGLAGTRDYRSLAGLSMVIQLLFPLLVYGCYITYHTVLPHDQYTLPVFTAIILFLLSLLISYLRPCKSLMANMSLSYHIMALGILLVALTLWRDDFSTRTATLETVFIGLPLISHLLVIGWAAHSLGKKIISRLRNQLSGH